MRRDPSRVALASVLLCSAVLFVAGSIVERHHVAVVVPTPPPAVTATVSPQGATPLAAPSSIPPPQVTPSGATPPAIARGGLPGREGSAEHEAAEHAQTAPTPSPPRPSPTRTGDALGAAGLQTPHNSPAPATPTAGATGGQAAGRNLPTVSAAAAEGSPQHEAAEKGRRLFGMNLESLPLVAGAALATLALAVSALAWRRQSPLWVIVAFALGFALLDVREILAQVSAGRDSLVGVAGVLVVLHLVAAGLAATIATRASRSATPNAAP